MDYYNESASNAAVMAKLFNDFVKCEMKEGNLKRQVLTIMNLTAEVRHFNQLFEQLQHRKIQLQLQLKSKMYVYEDAVTFLKKYLPTKLSVFQELHEILYTSLLKQCDLSANVRKMFIPLVDAINNTLSRVSSPSLLPFFSDRQDAYQYSVATALNRAISDGITSLSDLQVNVKVRINRLKSLIEELYATKVTESHDIQSASTATDQFLNAPITDIAEVEFAVRQPENDKNWEDVDILMFQNVYKGTFDDQTFKELPVSMRKYPLNVYTLEKTAFMKQLETERGYRENIDSYRSGLVISRLSKVLLDVSTALYNKTMSDRLITELDDILFEKQRAHLDVELIQGMDLLPTTNDFFRKVDETELNGVVTVLISIVCLLGLIMPVSLYTKNGFNFYNLLVMITFSAFYKLLDVEQFISSAVGKALAKLIKGVMFANPIMLITSTYELYSSSEGISDAITKKVDNFWKYSNLFQQVFVLVTSRTSDTLSKANLEEFKNFINITDFEQQKSNGDQIWYHFLASKLNNLDELKKIVGNEAEKNVFFTYFYRLTQVSQKINEALDWQSKSEIRSKFNNLSVATQAFIMEIQQIGNNNIVQRVQPVFQKLVASRILQTLTNTPLALALVVSNFLGSHVPVEITQMEDSWFWLNISLCSLMVFMSGGFLLNNAHNININPFKVQRSNRVKNLEGVTNIKESVLQQNFSIQQSLGRLIRPIITLFNRSAAAQISEKEEVFHWHELKRFVKTDSLWDRIQAIVESVKESRYLLFNMGLNSIKTNAFNSAMSIFFWTGIFGIITNVVSPSSVTDYLPSSLKFGALTAMMGIPTLWEYVEGLYQTKISHSEQSAKKLLQLTPINAGHQFFTSIAIGCRITSLVIPYSQYLNLFEDGYWFEIAAACVFSVELGSKFGADWCRKKKQENILLSLAEIHHRVYYVVQSIALTWVYKIGKDVISKRPTSSEFTQPTDSLYTKVNEWVNKYIFEKDVLKFPAESDFTETLQVFNYCIKTLINIVNNNKEYNISIFGKCYPLTEIQSAFNLINTRILDVEHNGGKVWLELILLPFYSVVPYAGFRDNTYDFTEVIININKDKLKNNHKTICPNLVQQIDKSATYVNSSYNYKQAFLLTDLLFPKLFSEHAVLQDALLNFLLDNQIFVNNKIFVCVFKKDSDIDGMFQIGLHYFLEMGLQFLSHLSQFELVLLHYKTLESFHEHIYNLKDVIINSTDLEPHQYGYELLWHNLKKKKSLKSDPCYACVFTGSTFLLNNNDRKK